MSTKNARQLWLPLTLSLLLTGCATSSPPVTVSSPPQIPPPPPELMEEPDLSQSYSEIVRKLLLIWQQKLTDWKRGS